MTFLLRQFLVGVANARSSRPAADPDIAGTLLSFAAQRNGKSEAGWRPIKASFLNATGDSWPDAIWHKWDSPLEGLYVPHSLGMEETAWKVGVHFARVSGFAADETWTFDRVPVSPPAHVRAFNRPLSRKKTQVRLHSLETLQPSAGISRLTGGLQTSSRHPDALLTVIAVSDENGRDLSTFGENRQRLGLGRPLSPQGQRRFAVDAQAGTRYITLTVALHKSAYVTFLAAPTLASATPSTPAAVR